MCSSARAVRTNLIPGRSPGHLEHAC
jgi:hypothetical protein